MPKHPRIGRRVACKRSGTVPRSNDQTARAGASKERISSHGVKGACQFGDNSMVIQPCGIRKASQCRNIHAPTRVDLQCPDVFSDWSIGRT